MSFTWIEKSRLAAPLRGTFISLGSALLTRMAAQLGFDWVLIDFVNIVVHIFSKETREYYEFERLWADGKITHVKDVV